MLKIGLLTARGSRHGGGVATVVRSLAASLKKSGTVEPVVFTLSDDLIEEERQKYEGVELVACPQIGPRSFGYSASLMSEITARDIDVLHLHGIWMHTSVIGHRWAKQTGKPYIISPHGMLEPWIRQHGRMKKVLAEAVYERKSHARADLVQALTVAEKKDILSFLPTARVEVIPNGVQLDVDVAGRPERSVVSPYILYLGRLHEKKNIDGLLDGWLRSRDIVRAHNARLVIAGYGDEPYVEKLIERVNEINADVSVEFVGSVFGEEKNTLIAGAQYLILPSFSEGLPMAILEAWALGTPTIMTDFCNLPQGGDRGAAIRIGTDGGSIAEGIKFAMGTDRSIWEERSLAARTLVAEQFNQDVILDNWLAMYQNLHANRSAF